VQRAEDGAAKAELLDEAACLSRLDLDEVANAVPPLEGDQRARNHVGQKPLRAESDQNQDERRAAESRRGPRKKGACEEDDHRDRRDIRDGGCD
jgi:hypothetical protein